MAAAEDRKVLLTDTEMGLQQEQSLRDVTHMQILRRAKELTKLPDDMEQYKNYYENKMLEALMAPGDDVVAQEAQSDVIDEYLSLRLKTCMMNGDFAS